MTTSWQVPVPGPIALAPARSIPERMGEKLRRHPYLPPDFGRVLQDLHALTAQGGVPATVDTDKKGTSRLLLYVNQYWLGLYELKQQDGYQLGFIEPLRLGQHETLLRGHLLLAPSSWGGYWQIQDIPKQRGYRSHWATIWSAWQQLSAWSAPVAPADWSERYDGYLDTLDGLVDAAQEIEREKIQAAPLAPYTHVKSAADQRYTSRGSYVFYLASGVQLIEGQLVDVHEEPDLRGKVTQVAGRSVTVSFEGAVDHARIPKQGSLANATSSAVYRARQRAVATLRRQEAQNPRLLEVLAGNSFQAYTPGVGRPGGEPDPEQAEAFRKALTVPDVLMVLGPPGTGKTYTIAQIVRACAARGQRVLLSSHTNRAVDNVLERMDEQLVTLRVGREEMVSAEVRPLLIGERAAALQARLAERTETTARSLEPFARGGFADRLADYFDGQLTALHTARQAVAAQEAAQAGAERRASAPFKPALDELTAHIDNRQQRIAEASKLVSDYWTRHRAAAAKAQQPVLGLWFRRQAARHQVRAESAQASLIHLRQDLERAQRDRGRVTDSLRQALFQDPDYQRCDAMVRAARVQHATARDDAVRAAHNLRHTVRVVEPGTPELRQGDEAALEEFRTWFAGLRPRLTARAALLDSWRERLQRRSEQFYPELVRYADVVGATCIGTATSEHLTAVEFDLAIIDEAGQIGVSDVLVPLVRAKRAVLVGDHRQLPPFVDNDVRQWAERYGHGDGAAYDDGQDDERAPAIAQVHDLLVKSAFELLFERAPATHRVVFTRQRRMPKAVADFVSSAFYGGKLITAVNRPHTDEIFRQALAVVDTSDLSPAARRERERDLAEQWKEPGYENPAEAAIIRDLIARYETLGLEWAVIVPYRAQATLIVTETRKLLGGISDLRQRVGTVDSFQGGERDVIVYGFTRSNAQNKVGFLSELRRLNVAMTRAKRQLVLVGDTKTLTNARDRGFRMLMRDLVGHAAQHGDHRASTDVRKLLRQAGGQA